jgi:hypothetical protein
MRTSRSGVLDPIPRLGFTASASLPDTFRPARPLPGKGVPPRGRKVVFALYHEYVNKHGISALLNDLMQSVLLAQPDEPISFMIKFLWRHLLSQSASAEQGERRNLLQQLFHACDDDGSGTLSVDELGLFQQLSGIDSADIKRATMIRAESQNKVKRNTVLRSEKGSIKSFAIEKELGAGTMGKVTLAQRNNKSKQFWLMAGALRSAGEKVAIKEVLNPNSEVNAGALNRTAQRDSVLCAEPDVHTCVLARCSCKWRSSRWRRGCTRRSLRRGSRCTRRASARCACPPFSPSTRRTS